jgi:hypothetical protein
LAPQKAGERSVYVAGDGARILAIARRRQLIERRNHIVPVEQDVESDDGRDDHQRDHVDERRAAGDQRFQESGAHAGRLAGDVVHIFLRVERGVGDRQAELLIDAAHEIAGGLAADAREQPLQSGEIAGQALDELAELPCENGRDQQHDRRRQHDEHGQNGERGAEAREAERLQAIGDRIEQIAERQPRQKRRENRAQKIKERENEKNRRRPKGEPPVEPTRNARLPHLTIRHRLVP